MAFPRSVFSVSFYFIRHTMWNDLKKDSTSKKPFPGWRSRLYFVSWTFLFSFSSLRLWFLFIILFLLSRVRSNVGFQMWWISFIAKKHFKDVRGNACQPSQLQIAHLLAEIFNTTFKVLLQTSLRVANVKAIIKSQSWNPYRIQFSSCYGISKVMKFCVCSISYLYSFYTFIYKLIE